jgi:phthalate 4,5-dioxygenase
MLKPEDNERVTRVGKGTPMGELFRRYWIPRCWLKNCPRMMARRCACVFWAKT